MEMFSEKGVGVGEREDLKKNTEGGEEQGFRLQRDLIKWGGLRYIKTIQKEFPAIHQGNYFFTNRIRVFRCRCTNLWLEAMLPVYMSLIIILTVLLNTCDNSN